MNRNENFRAVSLAAALAAVLMASSCASPANDGMFTADPDANHPITVSPGFSTLQLSFATPAAGLMPEDEARFDRFVGSYLASGNGAISISVPRGPGAIAAIGYFGERLAKMGVARSRILVTRRDLDDGDPRVTLRFVTYRAKTDPCGDWSKDAAVTFSNLPMPNLGCATQHNLAAMVSDPRDLVDPRPMGPSDAMRRATVMQNYQAGKVTAAEKSPDQTVQTTNSQ